MQKAIIGKKIGMTQIFDESGKVIPVTVVEAGPCVVIQKKTTENDGYESVQIGYGDITAKHVTKPMQGHFAKADVAAKKTLKEFRLADCAALNVGDVIKADTFAVGDIVDVSGTSKGKGFAGAIKRHNQHRLKETHGTGPVHRQAGSMGACSSPSRIYKGKGMAGHMGAEKVTVQNLEIVKVDSENNLIAVKGAIPVITDSVKAKRKEDTSMAKIAVFNMAGQQVSETELSDAVFAVTPNEAVMHAMVVNYLANQRQGTQSTLTRTEVAGGGRKPWRQKGTGHARQGSIRAPQWTHGGVALGPKPRSYRYSLTKKTRKLAMKSALSTKVQDQNMIVLDSLQVEDYKTKTIVAMLKALNVEGKALLVTAAADQKVVKSAANIPGVKTAAVNTLNVYDILNYDKFIVSQDAVAKLEEVYAK